jgi:probable rRNA maturation factor
MIHIESRSPIPIEKTLVKEAAQAALEHESAPDGLDLTLVLTDDAQLCQLNRDFLGVDAPTDVLSFPASGATGATPQAESVSGWGEPDPETGVRYLGDVIISVPRAAEQAQIAGHSLEAEVQLLVVHGILHLMGHDHAGAQEKTRMWIAQAEVLERLGLSRITIHE